MPHDTSDDLPAELSADEAALLREMPALDDVGQARRTIQRHPGNAQLRNSNSRARSIPSTCTAQRAFYKYRTFHLGDVMNTIVSAAFVAVLAFVAGASIAATPSRVSTPSSGITTSTDAAKISAIEKHAKELQARPTNAPAAKPSAAHAAKKSSLSPHSTSVKHSSSSKPSSTTSLK